LDLAIVDDPLPLAKAARGTTMEIGLSVRMAEQRDPVHAAPDLGTGFDQVHGLHLTLAQHHRALHPRGPGANDQHALLAIARRMELLGVPAPAVLLACGRVLGTDQGGTPDFPA